MAIYRRTKLRSLRRSNCFSRVEEAGFGIAVTTGISGIAAGQGLLAIVRRTANLPSVVGADLRGLLVLALNGFVHFAPMYRNLARRFNAEPHFVAAHVYDGDDDIITDDDTLVALAGKDKHDTSLIGFARQPLKIPPP